MRRLGVILALLLTACVGGDPQPDLPEVDVTGSEEDVMRAVEEARAAVEQEPRSPDAWGRLGDRYRAHGWPEAAETCYLQAEALEPGQFRWPHLVGRSRLNTDPGGAAEAFARALAIDPDYAPARVLRAECLVRTDRQDEARGEYETARRIDPGNAQAAAGLGQLLLSAGEYEAAREALESALEIEPRHGHAHRSLAQVHLALGNEELARDHASAAQSLTETISMKDPRARPDVPPVGSHAHLEAGIAWMREGKLDPAAASFREALRNNPDHSLAHFKLAQIHSYRGQHDQAVAELHEVLRTRPDNAETLHLLGRELTILGDLQQAEEHLSHALRLEPENAVLQFELGDVLIQGGRREPGEGHLLQAVELDPASHQLRFYLGTHLAKSGRNDEAVVHLQEAARLEPDDADTRVNLGLCLALLERPAEAAIEFREALRLDAGLSLPARRLAWILATHPDDAVRDGEGAVRFAESAARQGPDALTLDTLAAAYAEVGRFDEAARMAERAHGATPNAALARRIGQRIELYRGRRPFRTTQSN